MVLFSAHVTVAWVENLNRHLWPLFCASEGILSCSDASWAPLLTPALRLALLKWPNFYFFPVRIYWLEARNFSSFLQFTKKKYCYISSHCLPNEQVGIANTTPKHCSLPTGQRWWCQTNLHASGRKSFRPGPGVAVLVGLEIRSLELKLGDRSPYFLGKGFLIKLCVLWWDRAFREGDELRWSKLNEFHPLFYSFKLMLFSLRSFEEKVQTHSLKQGLSQNWRKLWNIFFPKIMIYIILVVRSLSQICGLVLPDNHTT